MNITCWAYLLQSGLKDIFHWKAQSLIFFSSLFNSVIDAFVLCTSGNIASSGNSLVFDDKPTNKSLI